MKLKLFITTLLISICFLAADAQVYQADQIAAAQSELAEAGVDQDEVKRRLRAKGIDLDNIQPEQVGSLVEDIKGVIEEIKSEQNSDEPIEDRTSSASDAAPKGAVKENKESSKVSNTIERTVLIETPQDSIKSADEKRFKSLSKESADEVIRKMKNGATLDEAIYEVLTEEEQNAYAKQSSVYGMDVFFNKSLDVYRSTSSSTTPNSYVLDVGDKIAINIFGASQADLLYEIEEDGFIRPTRMPKIYLKGVTLSKAKRLLEGRFRQAYAFNSGQFDVTLHTARTITINIFGEVQNPGSYTISALNTALNALVAADGPNADASLRYIEINSNGRKKILDVYDFMVDPRKQFDYYLSNNDLIYIPKYTKRVSVTGPGIRRPAVYELEKDEHYKAAVKWAGGYSTNVYEGLAQHIFVDEGEQKIKDYDITTIEKSGLKLSDGDRLVFHKSVRSYENFVQISGSVRHPGRYEVTESFTVYDLLIKARLEKETFSDMAYLTRKNVDGSLQLKRVYVSQILADSSSDYNFKLQNEDRIALYSKAQFVDNYSFTISGAVRSGGKHFWDPSKTITLYDAIVMSRGFKGEATNFGYIISSPPGQPLKQEYTVVDLKTAYENPNSEANITINPNDSIVVPSTTRYTDQYYVEISGAVRSPGRYIFDSTLSVKDILVIAGGLKMEAASNKVDIFRLKVENNEPTETYAATIELDHELNALEDNIPFELKPYDHIVVRKTPYFDPIKYVTISGEVMYPGTYAIIKPNEKLSSIIERAGGYTNEAFPEAGRFYRTCDNIGYIVTRFDLLDHWWYGDRYDIALKEGDSITVPDLVNVVQIEKTGTNADSFYIANITEDAQLNTVVNHYDRRANWFVKQFTGGFSKDAKKNKTCVVYPNGHIKRTKSFLFFKCYPKVKRGSEITLVLKQKARIRREKELIRRIKMKKLEEGGGYDMDKDKDKKTFLDRMTELNAIASISMSTALTFQTLLTVLNGTK